MRRLLKQISAFALASLIAVTGLPAVHTYAETSEPKTETNMNGVTLPDGYHNRKVVGYFPNYALNLEPHKNFSITDLQWDKLTHVQYAFVVADENTYELVPSDPKNDVESTFDGRKFYHKGKEIKMDNSLDYKGQFNLMNQMQKQYPNVTVLASTGGWAASRTLWKVTDNEANMKKFADSAVKFIRKYGFNGIDIDFEYPSETSQSGNPADFDLSEPRRKGISERYTQFIHILRDTLDEAAKQDNTYYWLTSAVSASSWVLGGQTSSEFLDYLDFVSVMSYDYHGGWNQYVENQANLFADPNDTETINMALPTLGFDWSYHFYRGAVQSEKILMGVPYYTRGWTNVSGGTNGLHGTSKTPAVGNENIWHDDDENGKEVPAGANPLWHVLNLMKKDSNYKKYWDNVGKVPYVWNDVNKTFLTFEDEQSIQERINVVKENNLGGVLIWVMHGDYSYDEEKQEYTVGDTLTSMLYNRLTQMGPAKVTSDIDVNAETADFDVKFGGKYDHPNYTYEIYLTNNTGKDLKEWELSFDLPKSAVFASAYGSTFSVKPSSNKDFNTVTLKGQSWNGLPNGGTAKLQGAIKLNFAGVKNFKLNGKSMKSEVEAERKRLGMESLPPIEKPDVTPTPTDKPDPTPTEKPEVPPVADDHATQAPAVPAVTHDNWDKGNNFTITWNLWWGENASSAEIYEDDVLIDSKTLTPNSPNAQSGKFAFKDVKSGTHTYKIVLKNSKGSSSASVNVTVN